MEHYTYRVTWSEKEGEFVGLCTEIPTLSHFDDTHEKALAGIIELVRVAVEMMRENGQEPPEALASKAYSGKFIVRVPPAVHRALAMEAAEQGVSINRLVAAKLG